MSFHAFSLQLLASHPLATEAHNLMCFIVWLLPFICNGYLKSVALSLILGRSVARPYGSMCVLPIKVMGEMSVQDFWELWAQTSECNDNKQYFLETHCLQRTAESKPPLPAFLKPLEVVLFMLAASVWLAPGFYQMPCFVSFVGLGKKHRQ